MADSLESQFYTLKEMVNLKVSPPLAVEKFEEEVG